MEPTPEVNILSCSQCGGELHPDEGQIFLTCPYCSSTVFIDKSRVVFHWYVAPTLDRDQALGALRRWMTGSQTVKDLDEKSRVIEVTFQYFPMWHFKFRRKDGSEEIHLTPAAATAISEIGKLILPAGDLRKYTPEIEPQSQAPSVPLTAAQRWAAGEMQAGEAIIESSLVHIPVFQVKYNYKGSTYSALIEAATGEVFANLFPAKAEAPYLAVGLLTAAVFICLALIPLGTGAAGGGEGAVLGLGICAAAGLIAGPILFALAAWVAAKV